MAESPSRSLPTRLAAPAQRLATRRAARRPYYMKVGDYGVTYRTGRRAIHSNSVLQLGFWRGRGNSSHYCSSDAFSTWHGDFTMIQEIAHCSHDHIQGPCCGHPSPGSRCRCETRPRHCHPSKDLPYRFWFADHGVHGDGRSLCGVATRSLAHSVCFCHSNCRIYGRYPDMLNDR